MRQFYVVGRGLPTEAEPNPQVYRMRLFARDQVLARSKFWYHMKRQHKIRKIQGEIIQTSEVSNATLLILSIRSSRRRQVL